MYTLVIIGSELCKFLQFKSFHKMRISEKGKKSDKFRRLLSLVYVYLYHIMLTVNTID